jgi:myo-inositol 2-dehydrogenase/D-chiro-inositol 1-dehydrogenase
MVVLRTESGKLCHINNSRAAIYGHDQRVEILGSNGMLISGNRRAHGLERFGPTATGAGEPFLNFFIERYAEAYALGLESFIDCVETNATPDATFEDGEKSLVLAEAANLSRAERRFVNIREIVG